MAKRDVEISVPTFDTLEESLEYAQRFQHPQSFLDEFVKLIEGRIELSAYPRYDPNLLGCGSAVISHGREAIKIGGAGLIRDSELFKTLVHEEMHLRLIRKARDDGLDEIEAIKVLRQVFHLPLQEAQEAISKAQKELQQHAA